MNKMNTSPAYLDDKQKEIAQQFATHAHSLQIVVPRRYEQCIKRWRICDPLAGKMADKMCDSIRVLEEMCRDISDSIETISTAKDSVSPAEAEEYLAQELRLIDIERALESWYAKNKKIRTKGCELSDHGEDRIGNTEHAIYAHSIQTLGEQMSNISPEDECLRSCIVLGQVQKRRVQLWTTFATSPIQIGRTIGATMISIGAYFGATAGIFGGASAATAQYTAEAIQSKAEFGKLSIVEGRNKKKVYTHLQKDGEHVRYCLDRAGIWKEPENVLKGFIPTNAS